MLRFKTRATILALEPPQISFFPDEVMKSLTIFGSSSLFFGGPANILTTWRGEILATITVESSPGLSMYSSFTA